MSLYIALLHYPVYNKRGEVITTSITSFDLHDIARASLTYGIKKYYVVNPIAEQRKFAERIISCWRRRESFEFNPTRAEAFEILSLKSDLEEVKKEIGNPVIVVTSAKERGNISFKALSSRLKKENRPYLLLFGTGWGLAQDVLEGADYILEPVKGLTDYNHLSVRSAVAIILDRLLVKR